MSRALGLLATLGLLLTGCGGKDPGTTNASTEADPSTGPAEDSTSSASDPGESSSSNPGSNSNSASNSTPDPSAGTTEASASEASPTTVAFLVEVDGGISGECDPKTQDCPEGEKCSAVSDAPGEPWGINKCVPLTGDDQPGDPCDIEGGKYTGLDNCDVGVICLLTDDEGLGGACVEFCDANLTCPKTGAKCVVYNEGSLPICLDNCDPLVQDCPEGQACYNSAGDDFVCFKESAMPGEGEPGSECAYINQCQEGSFCANAMALADCSSASCCTPYCPVSEGATPCQAGEECVPFFAEGMAPPGFADVGVCAVPE